MSRWLNAIICFIVFSILGGIFIYIGLKNPILSSFLYTGIIFIIVGVIWILYTAISGAARTKKINYLTEKGIKGTATIVNARTTGVYINRMPRVKITFRIELPGKQPYEIKKGKTVGYLNLSAIQIGATFPCYVDENNPKKVYIQYL